MERTCSGGISALGTAVAPGFVRSTEGDNLGSRMMRAPY